MEPTTAKLISLFVVLAVTYIFGILPIAVLAILKKNISSFHKIYYCVSLLNSFAGGVFLGTCILHLILESIEVVKEAGIAPGFDALPGVLIGVGFFIVLFLEHVIGKCSEDGENIFHDHGHNDMIQKRKGRKIYPSKTNENSHNGKISDKCRMPSTMQGFNPVTYQDTNLSMPMSQDKEHNDREQAQKKKISLEKNCETENNKDKNEASVNVSAKLRSVILLVSLSIHMVFEGMAIGLQDTETDTWTLLAALSVHKCVLAFGVGLKMKETMTNKKILISMILFASVSPIGVAIGIGISSCDGCGDAQQISEGVLQSIAAGVFLYVTFFEILQKELTNSYSFLKVFLCFIGFGAMAAIKVLD